jgi:hypothetical protein
MQTKLCLNRKRTFRRLPEIFVVAVRRLIHGVSLLPFLLFLTSPASPLRGQTLEEEVRAMRQEIQELRQEIEALKGEVRQSKLPAATAVQAAEVRDAARPETAGVAAEDLAQEMSVAEMVPLLQSQVAEQAQTKVESNSRMPVKIFGTVLVNTFFNSGEANWLDNPNLVMSSPAPLPAGSFSLALGQTRLGATAEGPTIGRYRSSGFLAVDFLGGIPNFQTGQVMGHPRLLYAFVRLESERTAFEFGQDHMILAPRNPTSLAAFAFPDLYRSGNLYFRAPQARVEHLWPAGRRGELQFTGGILAPIGGDFNSAGFAFVPPNLAGERSKRPGVQARLAWRTKPDGGSSDRGWEVGVSGHYARERFSTGLTSSRVVALDFDAHAGRTGLGGEWFVGQNIDAFGGSLGQLAKSTGGFVEARLKATSQLDFNAGFGTDRLFDRNLFPAPLEGNASVFTNAIYQFTPELAWSVEYRWLRTSPVQSAARTNNHVNFALAYSF